MPGRLIPPPDLAPPSIRHLPFVKKIELWYELIDEAEALVLSGLRAKIGPDGDLQTAYREWYARKMDSPDRFAVALAENLSRREARHGG
jgi:hypothetical protein